MLLLSNPRWASAGRASLLLLAAVLLHVTSASPEAAPRCSRLNCTIARRHYCKTGSSVCGPCLSPLVENDEGHCVSRRFRHKADRGTFLEPDLDEEIDYLHSVIQKQQVSDVRPGPKQTENRFAAISFQSGVRTKQPLPPPVKEKEIQNVQTTTKPPDTETEAAQPTTTTPSEPTQPVITKGVRVGPIVSPNSNKDKIMIIMVTVCVAAGSIAVILAAVCAVKLQRDSRLTQKVDYPAFGGATVAPAKANGTSPLDHTLAQNAQMFHYQHQKQQMLSMGKQKPEAKAVDTDVTSDEEDVGGDFTVYECPGLAPTGEMEVKNPLFDDSLPYQGNQK